MQGLDLAVSPITYSTAEYSLRSHCSLYDGVRRIVARLASPEAAFPIQHTAAKQVLWFITLLQIEMIVVQFRSLTKIT